MYCRLRRGGGCDSRSDGSGELSGRRHTMQKIAYAASNRLPTLLKEEPEKKGKVVPVEVKASNASTASLNGLLERDDIEFGYKFTSGNVGGTGKKITLPHYMMMFI